MRQYQEETHLLTREQALSLPGVTPEQLDKVRPAAWRLDRNVQPLKPGSNHTRQKLTETLKPLYLPGNRKQRRALLAKKRQTSPHPNLSES
jgi:hypothetical protein